MIEQFDDRAELVFEGVPAGPFRGRDAIAAAYAARPPDDEVLALAEPAIIDSTVVAPYGWRSGGGEAAGRMLLTAAGPRIRRLEVTFSARDELDA
jgi:steroid Delta-isomerase